MLGLTLLLGVASPPAPAAPPAHLAWRLDWGVWRELCLMMRGEVVVLTLSRQELKAGLVVRGLAYSLPLAQVVSDLTTGTWVKLARVS